MAFNDTTGPVATKMCTLVSAESTRIAFLLFLIATATRRLLHRFSMKVHHKNLMFNSSWRLLKRAPFPTFFSDRLKSSHMVGVVVGRS